MIPLVDVLVRALIMILGIVEWIVIVWVILSWLLFFATASSFRWKQRTAFHILEQLNDICSRMAYPFIRPFRRLLRRVDTRGIDWSPLLLLIFIWIVRQLLLVGRVALYSASAGRG
jgi:uncharacterized protein YggT (Ycf19 family)